jgi:hypothetical protein
VLPVLAPRPSTNRKLIVHLPRTPYVHAGTAWPRVGQSRAPSSLARPVVRRPEPCPVLARSRQTRALACQPSPSWFTRIGSARPRALVLSLRNRCNPMAPPGNRIGRMRTGPAAAACSCTANPQGPLDPPSRKVVVAGSTNTAYARSTRPQLMSL